MTRSYEDFFLGELFELPPYQLDEEEMIAFAQRYDPQDFHTDPQAAEESPFGGLIASGWLTTSVLMRMQCDGYMADTTCIGSPGVDEIRWLAPVRPGDVLSGTAEVVGLKPSRSRPDRGLVSCKVRLCNQTGEVVMTLTTLALFLTAAPESR